MEGWVAQGYYSKAVLVGLARVRDLWVSEMTYSVSGGALSVSGGI